MSEIVKQIVVQTDPEKIILFGSYARGLAGPDSDLDLLIVEREPFGKSRSRWEETARIREVLSPFRISKDILLYSMDEVRKWEGSINHILPRSLREGKLLYERS